MRLLANENVPRLMVEALRSAGHDTVWIRESAPGTDDISVLETAAREQRVRLTFDQDFGVLALRASLPSACSSVLCRLPLRDLESATRTFRSVCSGSIDLTGRFTVVSPGRIRSRPIPYLLVE